MPRTMGDLESLSNFRKKVSRFFFLALLIRMQLDGVPTCF